MVSRMSCLIDGLKMGIERTISTRKAVRVISIMFFCQFSVTQFRAYLYRISFSSFLPKAR